jgi:hypothetical protein
MIYSTTNVHLDIGGPQSGIRGDNVLLIATSINKTISFAMRRLSIEISMIVA